MRSVHGSLVPLQASRSSEIGWCVLLQVFLLACVCGLPLTAFGQEPVEEAGPGANAPLEFFPDLDVTYTLEAETATSLFVGLEAGNGMAAFETVEMFPDAEGAFAATVSCRFLGDGTLRIQATADPEDTPLFEVPVRCTIGGILEEAAGGVSAAASTQAAAAAAPMFVRGVIHGFTKEKFDETVSTTTTTSSSGSNTNVQIDRQQRTTVRDGDRECTTTNVIFTSCRTVTPNQTRFMRLQLIDFDRNVFISGENFEFGVTTIQNFDIIAFERVNFTIRFPDLPEGARIEAVTVVGDVDFATLPTDAFTMMGLAPNPIGGGGPGPGNCSNGRTAGRFIWLLPGVAAGNELEFDALATSACPFIDNGSTTETTPQFTSTKTVSGSFSRLFDDLEFFAEVAADDLTLMLQPGSMRIDPKLPGSAAPTTPIRAMVMGGSPGDTHTVTVELAGFDAGTATSGHSHGGGVPPQALWGTVGGALSASCSVTTNTAAPPEGTCEIEFASQEVSGKATFEGRIDGEMVEDDTEVEVGIAGLGDVGPLFSRTDETLNSVPALDRHPNPYHASPAIAVRLVGTQRDWEAATATYLSWNDMSLPLGGLFDISGTWATPHATHRVGKSVDINRKRLSVASPGTEVLPRIDDGTPAGTALRRQLSQVCARNGGRLYPNDRNLHCEYR